MKRWKALVLLGMLCLGLLLPWQAARRKNLPGQLAEESGAAGGDRTAGLGMCSRCWEQLGCR